MKRSTTLIACALLATTALSACGDDAKSGSTSTAGYCAKILEYKTKSDELNSVFSGTPDSKKIEEAFTTMQSMVNGLKTGAPAEIKSDVQTMSTAIDSVVEIFSKYNWDFVALASAPEFAELQSTLAGTDMSAASARLEAFSADTCGIKSDTTST